MGTFASGVDKRRARRLAERDADGRREPINQSAIPPGLVTADAAGSGQLLASGINFDRAGFAFDVTNKGPFTVNGTTSVTQWTKVGGISGNLRLPLGALDTSIYVWVWATFGWSLASAAAAADHGRCVAVLYDSLDVAATGIVRASNPMSNFIQRNDNFYEVVYLGFLAVNPNANEIKTEDSYTGQGDWNIGIQMQYAGDQKVGNTTINRQSIIAFVSDFPFDGATNYEFDELA